MASTMTAERALGESRPSVLLVDDAPANLLALEAVLAPLGHRVVQAGSGEEALRRLLQEEFCVVLLDVQMAGMDGFETARLIKSHPRTAQTPIIFITAINRAPEHVSRGYEQGGVDYLVKPFDPHILRSKVAVFVDLYVSVKRGTQQEMLLRQKERVRVERRGEERYRGLAESIPIAIWTTRADGGVTYSNRAWTTYSGTAIEEGASLVEPEFVHPNDLDGVRASWGVALREGSAWEMEYRLRRRDGIYRWHIGRGVPQRDHRGRVTGWVVTATDIDQHKTAEELRGQLLEREQRAREVAEDANRAKDEFLATMSHELRTPLNAIIGWIELLRGNTLDAVQSAEALATIARNANAQRALVEDILDVSRIVTGKLTLEEAATNVTRVVRDVVESFAPMAAAKGVAIDMTLGTLDEEIVADGRRMRQVVSNLLGNAIKFTAAGGRVEVHTERTASTFIIRITDDGEGISKEFLPHVFDRFRQADSSITRAHRGLGLGLAIVRHVVLLHGGEVRAESAGPGCGSTFTASIPVRSVPLPSETSGARGAAPEPLDHICVLVVDDDDDARALLERYLSGRGASVVSASSVEQAFSEVQQARPHVIVSDLGMPGEDGFALIRRVRGLASDIGGTTPAIAVTGFASNQDRAASLEAGFQGHVPKPVDLPMLARLIGELAR